MYVGISTLSSTLIHCRTNVAVQWNRVNLYFKKGPLDVASCKLSFFHVYTESSAFKMFIFPSIEGNDKYYKKKWFRILMIFKIPPMRWLIWKRQLSPSLKICLWSTALYMVGGENWLLKIVLWYPCVLSHMSVCTYM